MALQGSGEISIADIKTEIGSASGSLRTLSNLAGKSSPDAMSEFHGYSHLTSYTSSDMGVFNETCHFSGSLHALDQTYYHNGSGTYPTAGDTCYSNSSGSSVLAAGYYTLGNSSSGTGNRNYIKISGTNGVVDSGYPDSC